MATSIELPELPARSAEIVDYIADNPGKPMSEIMAPYRDYEAKLRSLFAQDRGDQRLNDPYVNVIPLFTDKAYRITTRARDLASESQAEKERYIMALPDDKRRPHGSPATVSSLKDFQKNFGIFSENSLADLDFSNVVAAGSSVVNCLLPVPPEFNTTKRKLREYYHEKFCPASDVDLFLYGLNEEQAIEKIKQIEQAVRDAILSEVTVVRTKYAITIASQYPTRHVQIVLRSYKSISEILTGFDIDAAGGAYDGNQVYVTPRALGSFITQVNQIDLSRRSPSYENRLSKYSHRNFEVYWPELDRSRVDPTIFERSFQRTLGLARLLVLEQLPTSHARMLYLNKRRQERGRPMVHNTRGCLPGNIKDYHEDEIADWVGEAEVSNYHTFTLPYGERFHAKKIEKLCYTRDLLLNAEWNQQKGRDVYLHRHPAFFGRVEDVIKDCCGNCPTPVTPKEIEVAEKEREIYISGEVKLLIDDPGRQQIGSFNPLTEDDWTDMAYVGNTARLCQSIVDSDVDEVLAWLSQADADPNRRDYTGRTPLQLAVMCSSPEVIKCFVDHGARLTARMADGKTALHLAAERGIPEIIKLLMEKSITNEELEGQKQDQKLRLMRGSQMGKPPSDDQGAEITQDEDDSSDEEDSDVDIVDGEESDDGVHSVATGSFVKVKSEEVDTTKEPEELDESEPDFYKIDVLAWDIPSSPLHLAIACGHEDVVKMLCDYGGDALFPVKFLNSDKEPVGAILALTLAVKLPLEKAKSMAKLLLGLGATSSQADIDGWTALHRYIQLAHEQLVDILLENDERGTNASINHLTFPRYNWGNPDSPLHQAVSQGRQSLVLKLINAGARLEIDFETWLKAVNVSGGLNSLSTFERNQATYESNKLHPLLTALNYTTDTDLAIALLERGANPNSMTGATYYLLRNDWYRSREKGQTCLDIVRDTLVYLRAHASVHSTNPSLVPGLDEFLARYTEGSYQYFVVARDIARIKEEHRKRMEQYEKRTCKSRIRKGNGLALAAMKEKISGLQKLEKLLVSKGAKTFKDLYPEIVKEHPGVYKEQKRKREVEKPYTYNFGFNRVTDLTDARKDAYIQLFEAAWAGDMEKIKSLTLHPWGEDGAEPPLKIAVEDYLYNRPWTLAFFRGHYDVAWGIIEIAHAQYCPPDHEKRLYRVDAGNEGSDMEGYSDSDKDEEPRVVSKTVHKKFTIDNVGEVSMQVKSRTKPLDFIHLFSNTFEVKDGLPDFKTCKKQRPWDFFIGGGGDSRAFRRYLDLCIHFGGKKYKTASEVEHTSYAPDESKFRDIVEKGKVKILKEVIRRTGAGIPLDHLVKQSGIEIKTKPRYYQGLTVYGKKRKDWATAGRNMYVKPTGLKTPPLLHAALGGRCEMVKWLLSDEPLNLYMEFTKSKAAQEDSRLQHLRTVPGRFESVVSKWLGNRNELVLHCAVMSLETDESIDLVKHLIKTFPWALEARDTENNTPLLTAAYFGRVQFLNLLIDAGADESVRNNSGENVIYRAASRVRDASQFKAALDLLDADLRTHLFKERTKLENGGMTPLHHLVDRFKWNTSPDSYKSEQILELLLKYSKGIELEMLNSAGDSTLHTAVMGASPWLTRLLVGFRPKLLYRENAVGLTPAELAYHKYMAQVFVVPDNFSPRERCHDPAAWVRTIRAQAEPSPPNKYSASIDEVWELCRTEMARYPDKRRLVSLHEANDVAKRLGERYTSSRYFSTGPRLDDDEEDELRDRNEIIDLVGEWTRCNYDSVWKRHKTEEEKEREGEARLEEVCKECGHRHSTEEEDDDVTDLSRDNAAIQGLDGDDADVSSSESDESDGGSSMDNASD